jgi:hypothetical protein
MNPGVLEHKLEEGEEGRESVWNTRKLPKLLVPGWKNRLFVACGGRWRGWFPLSGELLWSPDDEQAPYGLVFDSAAWRPVPRRPAPKFRGWRYVEGDEISAPLPPSPAT